MNRLLEAIREGEETHRRRHKLTGDLLRIYICAYAVEYLRPPVLWR